MNPHVDFSYPYRLGMTRRQRRIARRVRAAGYCIVLAVAMVLGLGTGIGGLSGARTVAVEMVEIR